MKPDENTARLFWVDTVRVIKIELVMANGSSKVVEFHRRDKVRELLGAQDAIGDFLLTIASARPEWLSRQQQHNGQADE